MCNGHTPGPQGEGSLGGSDGEFSAEVVSDGFGDLHALERKLGVEPQHGVRVGCVQEAVGELQQNIHPVNAFIEDIF